MADAIILSRGNVLASVTKMQTWANKITDETTVEAIEVRIIKLDEYCKDFKTLENNLFSFPGQVSKYEEFEDKYFAVREKLMRSLRTKQAAPSGSVMPPALSAMFDQQRSFFENLNATTAQLADRTLLSYDHVKLPKIEFAQFDGTYKNWPAFEDSFVSSTHNNQSLSNINKLKLLKRLLMEGPASLIKHLSETEAHYTEAWTKLKSSYDEKGKILTSYISTFLDLSSAMSGKASDIRSLCDKCDEIVIGIRTMGSEAEYRDAWLIQIILRKLDSATKQLWSRQTTEREFPTLAEFFKFLNTRCDGLDDGEIDNRELRNQPSLQQRQHSRGNPFFKTITLNSNLSLCPCCNANHHLFHCMKFRSFDVRLRRNLANQSGGCYNCLRMNYSVNECPYLSNCRICNNRHNSLLHGSEPMNLQTQFNYPQQQSTIKPHASNISKTFEQSKLYTHSRTPGHTSSSSHPSTSAPIIHQNDLTLSTNSFIKNNENYQELKSPNELKPPHKMNSSHEMDPPHVQNMATLTTKSWSTIKSRIVSNPRLASLPTALIHIRDFNGNKHFSNALLDSGSQFTFVSEKLVQRLRLGRSYSSSIAVNGLADIQAAKTRHVVSINASSRFSSSNSLNFSAYILPKQLTLYPADRGKLFGEQLPSLKLADPNLGTTREIDILFGVDLFCDLMQPEKIVLSGHTYAQPTIFGWILLGPQLHDDSLTTSVPAIITADDVNKTLQRFWELEQLPTTSTHTPDDQLCGSYITQSVKRNKAGRYIVRLTFSIPHDRLGHTRSAAVRRLITMERRFMKNPQLAVEYKQFMNEYLNLGHMKEIPHNEIARRDEDVFYLPQHAVQRIDSSTTKLRFYLPNPLYKMI